MLEGNIFVVSDIAGDIAASATDTLGMFAWDTRHLSRWVLTVNGHTLTPLSTYAIEYYATQFFLVPGTGTVYVDADLSIVRRRSVGREGFREDLTVLSHSERVVDLDLRMEAAADFADLFEVKDALPKKGKPYSRVIGDCLILGYQRELFVRETAISGRTVTAGAEDDNNTGNGAPISHAAVGSAGVHTRRCLLVFVSSAVPRMVSCHPLWLPSWLSNIEKGHSPCEEWPLPMRLNSGFVLVSPEGLEPSTR